MPQSTSTVPQQLYDLRQNLADVEDFARVLDSLRQQQSATIDGAWGSSASLATATLAEHAPSTLLVVIAHPGELDAWMCDLLSFAQVRAVVFPAWDNRPGDELDEVASQRLRLLRQLQQEPPRIVLTTVQALIQPVPEHTQFVRTQRSLAEGEIIDLDEVIGWLVAQGYRHAEVVEVPGEFARRGGILDIYSPDAEHPCRIELFGDAIDSLRLFSAQTQRSEGTVDHLSLVGLGSTEGESARLTGHLCDYLPTNAWTVLVETEELQEQGQHFLERVTDQEGLFSVAGVFQQVTRFPNVKLSHLPSPTVESACHLRVESVERFSGEVNKVRDELDTTIGDDHVLIACSNEAECNRLSEVLAEGALAKGGRLHLVVGRVQAGFRLHGLGEQAVVVLGGQHLFQRDDRPTARVTPRRQLEARAIDSFLDLNVGDLVVHVTHGIARFRGMKLMQKTGSRKQATEQQEDYLILEFRGGIKVYVPASRIDLVQKYVGGTSASPELSKYGGTGWLRRKERVQEAVLDLAADMLQLQASREAKPGIAYPDDSDWQHDFESAFPFQETPDQLTTLAELKGDMQRTRPMDRLICGDVGYGKTELAIRAAFKTIDNGRQVAVLVPTTVLAEQHNRTFNQRLAEYPFVVECLSRFRKSGEQKRIIERLGKGGVDVIIGTHRLLSKDVVFKDLGLVIIDEEQRFGVDHKERLKRLRQTVDVLTMTATPIPRTLHLSLLGIRDISNLETPPADRLSIETRIQRFDPELIRTAILREMNREGQVYFVHNRVNNIKSIADKITSIVPEANVAIVHGQMAERELEQNMLKFVRREANVLVATTIIESGLDIPNANTIFINEADHYGLADLHQLRGRVGRYRHRAYAYLLLDGSKMVNPNAAKRLKAIEEFTDLGAGFKIALRDLEIRGAGNILGTQQSGHIASVGYEMYCQLLDTAVRQMKNLPSRAPLEMGIDLPWPAYFPHEYIESQRLRIEAYRRLARVRKLERLEEFRAELRDRYGPLPESAEWMLRMSEIRILGSKWRLEGISLEKLSDSSPTDVVLAFRDPKRMQKLATRSGGRVRLVDANKAYFRLHTRELGETALYNSLQTLLQP